MAMDKIEPHRRKGTVSATKIIRGTIIITAIALLSSGVLTDGHKEVRNKAVRICYECIGIG